VLRRNRLVGQKPLDMMLDAKDYCTDDSRRGYDTSDIHLSAGGLQPCEVPVGYDGERQHERVPG